MPEVSCSRWRGVQAGAGFLAGTVAHGEPLLEQSVPERLYPMERTHTGAGENCEEEGVAGMQLSEQTTAVIPHSSCASQGGEEVEESGMKE